MFMILIQSGILLLNYVFLGLKYTDPTPVAAWGLGFTSVNIISKYLSWGIWDGMDWLVSQAYGRKDFKQWELYLNLWRYSILLLSLFQVVIFIFLDQILITFGQNILHWFLKIKKINISNLKYEKYKNLNT